MNYDRKHPSPRYQELLAQYLAMHAFGEPHLKLPADKTFAGLSLLPHAAFLKSLIERVEGRSLLDFGCGKGDQYKQTPFILDGKHFADLRTYFGIQQLCLYDPAYAEHWTLPPGELDVVVCTDVLEHCPEEDLDWILAELFGRAKKAVYAAVASYPAMKRLPNGENAHCTLRPAGWWNERFQAASAASNRAILWEVRISASPQQSGADCTLFRSGK